MKHPCFLSLFVFLVFATNDVRSEEFPGVLEPASVLKPLPVEYGDEHRLFQGIPSMTLAPNGRVWATWYSGGDTECNLNYILVASSADAGKTWTKPLFAVDVPGPVRLFDPEMWTDPDGRVWLFWAQSWNNWDGRAGVWCMTAENGDVENTAWSAPRRLCDGIMMCKPIVDSKGRWILPVSIWTGREHPERTLLPGAHAVVSGDKGKTWASLGHVVIPREDANCDEHMIVEKKDGSFWMLVRTKYGIGESFSTDGGVTWTPLKKSAIAHTTSRFFIWRLQSGNLLLVKHGGIDVRAGRSDLTAYLSDDDGKTWKGGLMLDHRNGVSYPDGFQAKDGTIYVIYDYGRHGEKEILMARFTEKDVLAQKIVSENGELRLLVNKSTAVSPQRTFKFKADPNSDGKPFQAGESALLEFGDVEQDVMKKDAKIFTDRDYVVNEFPRQLEGLYFARSGIGGCTATCLGNGMVYVLTPSKTRNKDSVVDELVKQGFEKVAVPETLLFGNIVGNIVTTYQKKAKDGEKIRFGKWGVLVYGKKGKEISADSLQPATILKPIPAEYGDDQRLFQGIPSMALAPNGRVWANWYTGGDNEGDENYVLAATSGDLGHTWSKPLFAVDIPGPVRAYDPAMWTDPDGRTWLFWAQSKKWWDGRSGVWCMTSENADQENAVWSAPRRLCDGIMMCKPIVDSKGRWLAPVSIWTLDPKHVDKTLPEGANVVVSEDKGKTWKRLGGTVVPKKDAIFDEHMLVEKKDGTLWMLIRTKYGIADSFSSDGGKTWSDPTPSELPHPSARFFIRRLKSGNLLLVKHGPLDKRTGRSHLTAYLSSDDGKTWQGGLMLDERNGVSYPDGDQTADGTILVIYDFDRTGDKEILMARFLEGDVLAGKIESPKGVLRMLVNKSTAKKVR